MLKMVQKVQDLRDVTGVSSISKFFDLKQTWINSELVISLEVDEKMNANAKRDLFACALPESACFTRVMFSNGTSIVVLGSPDSLLNGWKGGRELLLEHLEQDHDAR